MTEKKPKASEGSQYFENPPELAPLPATSMLLMKCGRVAGFDGRDGWPEAFTIGEIAALQFPDDNELQGDLIALLTPAMHDGRLKAVTVQRSCIVQALGNPWQYVDEPGLERKPAVIALRDMAEVEPSECVRAWLGPAWQEEAPKVGAGDTAPIERRTRAALIKDLQSEWTTIERDLQDASRNGLAAAKLADRRGWDKGRALEWAKEHGKLIEKTAASWYSPPAIFPTKTKRRSK